MKTVMAQGTFDVLHPGHIHYLEESRELGDELIVVITRDSRASDRKDRLVFDEEERRKIVDSLEAVDKAVLGSEKDIYDTVREVKPDTISLGFDQDHSREKVKKMAKEALGREVEVKRVDSGTEHSSSELKESSEN
ncbi:MAG: adenylyltransferase/cytidyltransferase family protein [Candidatus Nanosalina sp.]